MVVVYILACPGVFLYVVVVVAGGGGVVQKYLRILLLLLTLKGFCVYEVSLRAFDIKILKFAGLAVV